MGPGIQAWATRRWGVVLLALFLVLLPACHPKGEATILSVSEVAFAERRTNQATPLWLEQPLLPLEDQPTEQIWITGWAVEVVGVGDGQGYPQRLGFTTLDLQEPERHREEVNPRQGTRLFSLGPGVPSLKFPRDFGLPLASQESLRWTSGFLGLGSEQPSSGLAQRSFLDLRWQKELAPPILPLLARSASVQIDEKDSWRVPSGGSTVESVVSHELRVPYRTTLHAATVSLDSWARRVELWDLTENIRLLSLSTVLDEVTGAISKTEVYSDHQGILFDPRHSFSMRVTYDNPSEQPVRGSAHFTVYFYDHDFQAASP